jgi:hypothetical protein
MANVTERNGATKVPVQKNALSNWGVNRITQYIMFFGSLFTFFTFSESEIGTAVAAVFAVAGFVATVYEKAKNGVTADWSAWINNPNTWSNLTAILVGLLPALSPDAVKFLQNLVEGLIAGNWQQAITAAFSLVSILIFFFRKQAEKVPAAKG